MKICFLDIDGVLNSICFWQAKKQALFPEYEHKALTSRDMDPAAVARLNNIVDSTGSKIVVSSTLRKGRTFDELVKMLRSNGVTGDVVGVTPTMWRSEDGIRLWRGDEIQGYIDTMPSPPEAIAILDDSSDMSHLMSYLIHVDCEVGLQQPQVELAKAMLMRPYVRIA